MTKCLAYHLNKTSNNQADLSLGIKSNPSNFYFHLSVTTIIFLLKFKVGFSLFYIASSLNFWAQSCLRVEITIQKNILSGYLPISISSAGKYFLTYLLWLRWGQTFLTANSCQESLTLRLVISLVSYASLTPLRIP